MAPLFQLYTYLNGYGHLDEEAALYSLLLMDPRCLLDLLSFSLGVDSGFVFPQLGHQALWQRVVQVSEVHTQLVLAKVEQLDIHFNAAIARVERKEEQVTLWMTVGNTTVRERPCDFLVWAAPAQQFLKVKRISSRHRGLSSRDRSSSRTRSNSRSSSRISSNSRNNSCSNSSSSSNSNINNSSITSIPQVVVGPAEERPLLGDQMTSSVWSSLVSGSIPEQQTS